MIATARIDHRRDQHAASSAVARLVVAEYLKLRKRRGLVTSALVLTVVPVTTVHVVLAILHWQDPHSNGPSGGVENFAATVGALGLFSVVAGILVGATLGTGDLDAGVFRELVITGRSRRALFAARVPAGLALLLPIVGAGLVITVAASVGLAGSRDTTQSVIDPGMVLLGDVAPDATLILQAAAWLALVTTVSMLLALGVSSLLGSRGTSIAVLLGWWLVAMPLLLAVRPISNLLLAAPLGRLQPAILRDDDLSMTLPMAVVVLVAWTVAPLALGAWRTCTRDA
jgi:hypothetical protein